MNRVETRSTRLVSCPRCGSRRQWHGNSYRPFCSLRCRLIDLGEWLDERHRIPGAALASDSESAASGTSPGG